MECRKKEVKVCQRREVSSEYSLPHALLGHVSRWPPIFSERRLKHKAAQLVGPLKLGGSLSQCLLSEVGLYVCDLNVSVLHVQCLWINLHEYNLQFTA